MEKPRLNSLRRIGVMSGNFFLLFDKNAALVPLKSFKTDSKSTWIQGFICYF